MKTFRIKWSNEWVITAKNLQSALEEVQDNMYEASFDESQFDIEEEVYDEK
jgi:hypothetical protein